MTRRKRDVSPAQPYGFGADLDCVVSDTLKFKRKLRIGEDAYAVLRMKNGVQSLWDVAGMAMTGASVAASKIVAGTFFASSGGLLSMIGLGTAATPIGWVIATAVATGGVYYGVSRLVRQQTGEMVDSIPRFINTPIDMLGMQLFDLMGALALRVASIDGVIALAEREAIERHFVESWGYDRLYVSQALDVLTTNLDGTQLKAVAKAIAEFQAANPDCNGAAMQAELLQFLREIVESDGVLDEREELALEAISETFKRERALTLDKLGKTLAEFGGRTATSVSALATRAARSPKAPK